MPLSVKHTGIATGQLVSVRHSTHCPFEVSQTAVGAVHSLSLVQPARHVKSRDEQTGFDVGQSAFDRHTTHA